MRKHLQISRKIQARRKALGISQEMLAQLMGVSRQSVTKWETGQSAPDLDRLVVLADVLGVSLDFLLRDEADREVFVDSATDGCIPSLEEQKPSSATSLGEGALERSGLESSGPFEEVQDLPDCRSRMARFRAYLTFDRVLGITSAVCTLLGGCGLLTLWILSRLYPVHIGARYNGMWGYVCVYDYISLFWTCVGSVAVGVLTFILYALRHPRT